MTEARLRALKIVRDNPGIAPAHFSRLMWPDAEGHRRHTKCGYGVTRGGGMRLAAGGYLGKLRKAGLIRWGVREFGQTPGYVLTKIGREALEFEDS